MAREKMSNTERGRLGGFAAAASMTAEQRRERGRKAALAAAVSTVVRRWPDLTPEQKARIASVAAR